MALCFSKEGPIRRNFLWSVWFQEKIFSYAFMSNNNSQLLQLFQRENAIVSFHSKTSVWSVRAEQLAVKSRMNPNADIEKLFMASFFKTQIILDFARFQYNNY